MEDEELGIKGVNRMSWNNLKDLHARVFRCGHCGEKVSSSKGYFEEDELQFVYICPNCNKATYFDIVSDKQSPGIIFGNDVKNVPDNIYKLYNESRQCLSVQSYTASIMTCRKLLMNIAVEKGAKVGLSYKEYVGYLEQQHYTPPGSKEWVDHIRQKGNEANHEIKIMEKEDAEELIGFIEMLLKFIYEFTSKMKAKKQDNQSTNES